MANEKHDPWALLAQAREALVRAENRMMAPPHQVPDVIQRIDAALAESRDSATPVVESVVWRNTPDGEDAVVNNAVLGVWGWRHGYAWECKPLAGPSWSHRTESGLSKTPDEAKSAAIAAARGMK